LVAQYVKGKKIDEAVAHLTLLPKRASDPVKKLVLSAVANAKTQGFAESGLIVKNLTVDSGIVMMRRMERARGRAFPIRKRTSNLVVTLESDEVISPKEKTKTAKKEKVSDKSKAEPKVVSKKTETKSKTEPKKVKKAVK